MAIEGTAVNRVETNSYGTNISDSSSILGSTSGADSLCDEALEALKTLDAEELQLLLASEFGTNGRADKLADVLKEVLSIMLKTVQNIVSHVVPRASGTSSATPAEQSSTPVESSEVVQDQQELLPFKEKMKELVGPDEQGLIFEDELQFGIAAYQFYQKDPDLEGRFFAAFELERASGSTSTEAVRGALEKLSKKGLVTRAEAEWVNGLSFRAAQLDTNQSSLATEGQKTGLLRFEDALQIAEASLAGIQAGGILAKPRSFDSKVAASTLSIPLASAEEQQGFLWKPVSEADGNLVVLFPSSLREQIASAGIYSGERNPDAILLENGIFSGDDANGERVHFRFAKPGAEYSEADFIAIRLNDGSQRAFEISSPGERLAL